MDLYDSIALAKDFEPKSTLQESEAQKVPDRTMDVSLSVMEHLAQAKPADATPVQLGAMPLPN
jgi:hypothetical protein